MQQNGDLSVEEILESIKKVIARDNVETARADRYRRETEGVVLRAPANSYGTPKIAKNGNDDEDLELGEDEVLDLGDAATEMLGEDDALPENVHEVAEASSELLVADEQSAEVEAPLDQSPVTDTAAPAARPPLEALPTMTDSPAEAAPQQAEAPLERMVRESLRPMLREWLDANLEPMVERMVKAELERIIGKPV